MPEAAEPTIVIGAGVAGLTTALYLQRAGETVAVVDPLPPAGGASYGNAGLISADTSVPIALPGMVRKVPGWLTDRLGPLSVDPRYLLPSTPTHRRSGGSSSSCWVSIYNAMQAVSYAQITPTTH